MSTMQRDHSQAETFRIGERFLLSFDSSDVGTSPQPGRLQDLRDDGSLYIDIPPEVNPPRGTRVTVRSLGEAARACRFSSEILGRSRLQGRLPVIVLRAPEHLVRRQRREAHRVSTVLQARITWSSRRREPEFISLPAVMTDLSGGGARLFTKEPVHAGIVAISLMVPEGFVEEWAQRKLAHLPPRRRMGGLYRHTWTEIRSRFEHIQARIVRREVQHGRDEIHALSVAFARPHEGCYRLVRYLERQAAQKGLTTAGQRAAA